MTAPDNEPKRFWLQFSLRTLLILVIVSAVPISWIGWKLRQARKERAVIAWVIKNGGHIEYESLQYKSFWNHWENKWFGTNVDVVYLGRHVSDLSPLADFKKLRELDLSGCSRVSDLSPLAALKSLQVLDLYHTQVTDLSPVSNLDNLTRLSLYHTPVEDLSPVAEMRNLEFLDFGGTQVRDVSPLLGMSNLREVYLQHAPVSEGDVQALRKALQNCKIH